MERGGGLFRWGEREAAGPLGWAQPWGRSLLSVGLRRRRESLAYVVSGVRKYPDSGNQRGGVEKRRLLRGRKGWMCVRVENGGDVASPGKKKKKNAAGKGLVARICTAVPSAAYSSCGIAFFQSEGGVFLLSLQGDRGLASVVHWRKSTAVDW